jgi:hypothetical protein
MTSVLNQGRPSRPPVLLEEFARGVGHGATSTSREGVRPRSAWHSAVERATGNGALESVGGR